MERKQTTLKFNEQKSLHESPSDTSQSGMPAIEGCLVDMDVEKVRYMFPTLYDLNRQWTVFKGPGLQHYVPFDDETNMVVEIANQRSKQLSNSQTMHLSYQQSKDRGYGQPATNDMKQIDINAGVAVDLQTKQRYELSDRENTLRTIRQADIGSIEMQEIIDFNTKEMDEALDDGREPDLRVQPSRTRPAESTRRSNPDNFFVKDRSGKRYQKSDIVWLSKAWRKKNKNREPHLQEIVDGILAESAKHMNDNVASMTADLQKKASDSFGGEAENEAARMIDSVKRVVRNRQVAWLIFFKVMPGLGDWNWPLDGNAICNQADHPLVYTFMYLFSMDTFLPHALTAATVNRDTSKIDTLGALAFVMKEMIWNVQVRRPHKPTGPLNAYRGTQMTKQRLDDLREGCGDPNTVFNLIGISCVTTDKEDALACAQENLEDDLYPVVFEMTIANRYGQFFFAMDSWQYSAYFSEKELVLWDGLPYLVLEMSERGGGDAATGETFNLTESKQPKKGLQTIKLKILD